MFETHRTGFTLAAFLAIGAGLPAQSFSFPNFSSTANLTLNGGALQVGNALEITQNVNDQAGSFWYATLQPVVNGFDTVFTFRISSPATAADGMTFAIHNDPAAATALGLSGGALGYQGISTLFNAVVVEFDTYPNTDFGELAGNVISIHANGTGPTGGHEAQSIGSIAAPGTLASGQARQARVQYLPVPGVLNFFLDNLVTPLLSLSYSFTSGGTFASSGMPVGPPGLPLGTAYVGFSGGTGGLTEINAIESWVWTSTPASPFTLAITQPGGPGSVRVQVTNGIPGAFYLTAISFDALNATNPGQGWWGGLHIGFLDLYALALFNQAPFAGFLDGTGGSVFVAPSGLSGPYPPLYAVTRTFGAGLSTITRTSAIVTVVLL